MKRVAVVVACIVAVTSTKGQVDTLKMIQSFQEYMTPGPMHKLMSSLDGTWTAHVKMWMSPGGSPVDHTAKVVNKTIYNGLFQETVQTGQVAGIAYEGKGTIGYDNSRKRFVSTWIDNMSSGIMIMEGDYDEETRTFTYMGAATDPYGGDPYMIRQTVQLVDNNTQLIKMWGPDIATGKEYQTMEVTMKRKK